MASIVFLVYPFREELQGRQRERVANLFETPSLAYPSTATTPQAASPNPHAGRREGKGFVGREGSSEVCLTCQS